MCRATCRLVQLVAATCCLVYSVPLQYLMVTNVYYISLLFAAKLLLTPMKHMVVPPPMSALIIDLPAPASIVSFGPAPMCNDMAVLLSNGSVAIYKSLVENGVKEKFKAPGKAPTLVATYRYYSHVCAIDLVTVFDAILTSRQTREKLQCLYENLMWNNFRKTAVLKKI